MATFSPFAVTSGSRCCSAVVSLLALLFSGCGNSDVTEALTEESDRHQASAASLGGQTGEEFVNEFGDVVERLEGTKERAPAQSPEQGAAPEGLSDFAWDFYRQAADRDTNFVYSPYSISTAAAMLFAGAAGETRQEIASALRFMDEGERFHQQRSDLALFLDSRNRAGTDVVDQQVLRVSNDLWLAPSFSPRQSYLELLSLYYGAPVHRTNFAEDPERSRQAINRKVALDTQQLIEELLPAQSIPEDTALLLTNALYFKARWRSEFSPSLTAPATFNSLAGPTTVEMMQGIGVYGYAETEDYTAVSMDYSGSKLRMVAVQPTPGTFGAFVEALNAAVVSAVLGAIQPQVLELRFPKLEISAKLALKEELKTAGMRLAFTKAADFSELSQTPVRVSDAFHQATLIVDEEGTEAAAATAIVSVPVNPIVLQASVVFDHPFVFFLQDVATGAVLFVGHYVQGQ